MNRQRPQFGEQLFSLLRRQAARRIARAVDLGLDLRPELGSADLGGALQGILVSPDQAGTDEEDRSRDEDYEDCYDDGLNGKRTTGGTTSGSGAT